MMKGLLRGVVFAVVPLLSGMVTTLLPVTGSAQEAQPKVVITKPTYQFGVVEQGTPVEALFEIRNEGTAPLQILGIQPACGCTAAMADTNTVLPGKVAVLKTTLSTAGFSGRQAKTIRLTTNDPSNRTSTVTIEGEISPMILVDPPRVYFPRLRGGESASQTITVKVRPDVQAKIQEIKAGSDKVALTVSDIENGKKIVLTLAQNIPVGTFTDRITIKTTSEKTPLIQVPLFALVEGDWRAEPRDVVFGLNSKAPLQRAVRVVRTGKVSGKVVSVSSNNPAIQTALKSVEQGREYEVVVTITPEASGVVKGEVSVVTDHADPSQTKLTIPVFADIAAKGE